MSTRSVWLVRLVLVLWGSFLGLAFAELGARVLWPVRELPDGAEDLPVLVSLADLARGHTLGTNQGVLYRTDRFGLRGPDYESIPPASVFRIVVAGDSTAMGHGVREEDRYSDRLVPLLDAARPGERHEVVNAALSGLPARNVMDRLESTLTHYGGHLLVYAFSVNDLEGPFYERLAPALDADDFWLRVGEAERTPSRLLALIQNWGLRIRLARTPIAEETRHNYLENPAAWSEFTGQLDRFAALAAQRDDCAVLLVQPHLESLGDEHPYLEIYERVSRAARERGIHVTDAFPAFRGRWAAWYWVSPFDAHPNEAAHAMLAETLAQGLLSLPDSCWQRESDATSAASPR